MKSSFISASLYKNIPNIVSILGVLPLAILFFKDGFQYLIPLIIYNNIMDDLDGILAIKLHLKSHFGAALDNVCDAVAHIIFVIAIGVHYEMTFSIVSLIAVTVILLRVTSRITASEKIRIGSPTNELMRHLLLVLLTAQYFEFAPDPLLITVTLLNSISMLSPFPMPYLIRCLTKSATAIGFVNASLLVAWLIPITSFIIALCFFTTHLYSLISGSARWFQRA
jgi:phosphatidylglycerophosphate synthase